MKWKREDWADGATGWMMLVGLTDEGDSMDFKFLSLSLVYSARAQDGPQEMERN